VKAGEAKEEEVERAAAARAEVERAAAGRAEVETAAAARVGVEMAAVPKAEVEMAVAAKVEVETAAVAKVDSARRAEETAICSNNLCSQSRRGTQQIRHLDRRRHTPHPSPTCSYPHRT